MFLSNYPWSTVYAKRNDFRLMRQRHWVRQAQQTQLLQYLATCTKYAHQSLTRSVVSKNAVSGKIVWMEDLGLADLKASFDHN